MTPYEKAQNVQAIVRSALEAGPSALTDVPELTRLETKGALRVLEIQVFELADALAAVVAELDEVKGMVGDRVASPRRGGARRPGFRG